MKIKINFGNPNINAEGIRVYRGIEPLNPGALPAPLATIAGNATSYVDETVLKDQTYYYIFEVFNGDDVVRTGNVRATAAFYTGPGNQILKGGDLTAGYYGLVTSGEFIDWNTLINWSGMAVTERSTSSAQDWLKFIHKGKVLFIPKQPIGKTTWNALYAKGLVYGTDDFGPREYNSANAAVNQLRVINIGGLNFKVRLMRGLPPNANLAASYLPADNAPLTSGTIGNSGTPESYCSNYDLSDSEWNALMVRTMSWTPPNQKGHNWDRLDVQMTYNGAGSHVGLKADTVFMERISTQYVIARGVSSPANITLHPDYCIGREGTGTYHWWPVLEMI